MGHTASKDGRSFEKQRSELRVYGYSNPVFDNGKKRQLRRGRSLGNIYHPPQVQQYSEQLLKVSKQQSRYILSVQGGMKRARDSYYIAVAREYT